MSARRPKAKPSVAAVIPARYASSRFPGKVLADLGGRPVVHWVYETCVASGLFSTVIVAVDHDDVRQAVDAFGGYWMMTDPGHSSGTERVAEAARQLTEEYVINVQGDEPFIGGTILTALVNAVREPGIDVATPVSPIRAGREVTDPAVVKVVIGADNLALYFSRWPVPFARDRWGTARDPLGAAAAEDELPAGTWWRHLGLYAFRRTRLLELVSLPPGLLEATERLEQLRWLAHGARIVCVPVESPGMSIDTPQDLEEARASLRAAFPGTPIS